ncbi:BrnT family toxin [Luteibacter sp.]|uniref:BrnT family toxin n=1 Tax=Luteibacter sp. TaxID=1886636 RepID=UPI0031F32AE5
MNVPSFEWDETKSRRNEAKHGVTFAIATQVLTDMWAMEEPDDRHDGERRHCAIGAADDLTLFVVFTSRGDTTRLISARKANRHELTRYWNNRLLHS